MELRVSDLQMNAWISLACDTVKARQGTANDRYACFLGLGGKFELGLPFIGQPI